MNWRENRARLRARLPSSAVVKGRSEGIEHAVPHRNTVEQTPLRQHVAASIRRYLGDLDGCAADDLHSIVLREVEIPLFVEVLNHCEGNQSRAAELLGIHRATLRKKLREYGISEG